MFCIEMLRSAFLGADLITDPRNHKSADTDHRSPITDHRMDGRIIMIITILNVLYLLQSSLAHHLNFKCWRPIDRSIPSFVLNIM